MKTIPRIAVGLLGIILGVALLWGRLELTGENALIVGSVVSVTLIGGVGYALYYYREQVRRELLIAGLVLMAALTYAAGLLFSRWYHEYPLAASVVLVILICVVVWLLYTFLTGHRRTTALRPVAKQLGFEFHPGARPDPPGFPPLPGGRTRIIANVMQGTYSGARVTVFDHRYYAGSYRTRRSYRQTMICFQSERMVLPRFALRGKRGLRQPPRPFNRPPQEIVLQDAPGFARHYRLRGEDPQAVRAIFNARVIQFFEANPGIDVEATQDQLLVYRPRKRIKPDQLRDALAEAHRVFSLFSSAVRYAEERSA